MAEIKIRCGVVNPELTPGPYTYTIEILNPCVDISLSFGGKTGINKLVIGSDNPAVVVNGSFEGCTEPELGTIRVIINNGECESFVEKVRANPCQNLLARISSMMPSGGQQSFIAKYSDGNSPFTFSWQVKTPGVSITSGVNQQTVVIDRSDPKAFTLSLAVVDGNGCKASHEVNVPALTGAPPILQDVTLKRKCNEVLTKKRYYDILIYGSDEFNSLDISSIEIVDGPINGTVSIDYASGVIIYAGTPSSSGIDKFTFRIKNNSGVWSNTATFMIQHTPCIDGPDVSADSFDVECNTITSLDVLANDSDYDASTLEIMVPPLHGSAVVKSDGMIKYTPHTNYEGEDFIRYRVRHTNGEYSPWTIVVITVQNCCDNHNAGLKFSCVDNVGDYTITASNDGTIAAVASTSIEVDTGSGYGAGNQAVIAKECDVETEDTFDLFNGQAAQVKATYISTGVYDIEYLFDNPVMQSEIVNGLVEYLYHCRSQVLRLGTASLDTFASTFRRSGMSDFAAVANGFKFRYFLYTDTGECGDQVNSYVLGTHTYLNGITSGNQTNNNPSFACVCIRFSHTIEFKFKREITRSNGCPAILMEYQMVMVLGFGCGGLVQSLINSENKGSGIDATDSYDGILEEEGITKIQSIEVDGENILDRYYSLPSEFDALEEYVNEWLLSNGSGVATIYFSTDPTKIVLQITGTDREWENFTTDVGAANFTQLS